MSTMPAKHHQPLHNFTLPFLKWGHKQKLHVSHHLRRRTSSDLTNRLNPQPNQQNLQNGAVLVQNGDGTNLVDADVATEVNGDATKPWNLRPRRLGENDAVMTSAKTRGLVRDDNRLWISLSREEIEEDIYAFTGARPVRRPKKRSKIEQKQLDDVFPGLYLVGMSADSYRV